MDLEAVDTRIRESDGATDAARISHGGADDVRVLDFSANVNPLVPPGTARVYEAALATSRSYPSEDYSDFRAAAAQHVGCEPRKVIPTAGGMGGLRLAVSTTVGAGDRALVPAPSFGEYAREVRLQGAEVDFRPAADVLDVDPAGYDLAVVCQPNNPTGRLYSPGRLRDFADRCLAADTTFVVDEAFLEYTAAPTMAGRAGTVVLRSLTKMYGLPGLRMGFAVADGAARDRLAVTSQQWTLSVPAAAVGTHCLADEGFVAETRERVARERERMRDRLQARFDVRESHAPFLLLNAGNGDAVDAVLAEAREAGIAVRDARTFRRLESHVRVAVRRPDENDRLLDALDV